MSREKVYNHFNTEAFEYDGLIPKLIPKYHEQNQILLKLLPFDKEEEIKVLDLGCGTGVLAYLVLKEFPQAQVVASDLAEQMLKVSEKNLAQFGNRISFKQGNFDADDFGKDYHLILSGLATHHVPDENKPGLYKKIYNALKGGGVFLNREVILGSTPNISHTYHLLWKDFMASNGEDPDKWFNTYLEEDIPATMKNHLKWLKSAGFVDVGCHWQYLNFAIFGGCKER